MSDATVVIVLELDPAADCPCGSATVAGGAPRTFHGWLGLAAAIESLTGGCTGRPRPADIDEHTPTRGGTA